MKSFAVIALAKFNIAFTLTHNSKIIRQYRPATNEEQQLKRVAAICGDDFVQHALRIDWNMMICIFLAGWRHLNLHVLKMI